MRFIVFSLVVLGVASCHRHNPESCCVTQAECDAFGLDHAYPCASGNVCNSSGKCVAPQCTTSKECSQSTPYCSNGLCVAGCAMDSDCMASSATPYCGPDQVCVQCTQSSQCPAEAPTCDVTSHQCTAGGGQDAGVDGATATCVPELAFQRGGFFNSPQVYTIKLDDYKEHLVSNGTDIDMYPAWSPDGKRIAVARSTTSIWTVDPDGSNPHEVASYSGSGSSSPIYAYPTWSPDGTRIAWSVVPSGGGNSEIFTALAIGNAGTNLVPGNDAEGPMEWSPDGSKMLYISNQTGNYDVFVVPSTGGTGTNLTNRSGDDGKSGPHWSPDGSQIVFGAYHVWVMDANGSNLRNLTGTTGQEDEPIWSHDGSLIYYQASGTQLFVMNANGVNQHAIETNSAIDENPVPSPDGSMIAWVSYRDGNGEIYVAGADGSNPTRVTNNPADDLDPQWRPCP